jgi:hypothetical protein
LIAEHHVFFHDFNTTTTTSTTTPAACNRIFWSSSLLHTIAQSHPDLPLENLPPPSSSPPPSASHSTSSSPTSTSSSSSPITPLRRAGLSRKRPLDTNQNDSPAKRTKPTSTTPTSSRCKPNLDHHATATAVAQRSCDLTDDEQKLEALIEKWTAVSQQAASDLFERLSAQATRSAMVSDHSERMSLLRVLQHVNIEPETIRYNTETEEFY